MKKLVLLLAVVFSVSLFSCGGNKDAEANAADSAVVEEVAVEEVVDTVAADTVAADTTATVADAQ
jgi:hypothetical protein